MTAVETRLGLRVAVWLERGLRLVRRGRPARLPRGSLPADAQPRVAVSPDGTRLAWARNDGDVDAARACSTRLPASQRSSAKATASGLWTFAFSPDGTRLASGGEDRTARMWDSATGALLATCRGHASKVIGVAFSPDGTRLLTTSADGTVRQWDVDDGPGGRTAVRPPLRRCHSGRV